MKRVLSICINVLIICMMFASCKTTTVEANFNFKSDSEVLKVEKGTTAKLSIEVDSLGPKYKLTSVDFLENFWSAEGGSIQKRNIILKSELPMKLKHDNKNLIDYEINIPSDIPNGIYRAILRAVSDDAYNSFRETEVKLMITDGKDDYLTLAENGTTDWKLVHNENSSPAENFAAEELKKYFKAVTGAELADTEGNSDSKRIVIGCNDKGNDGFSIKTNENGILLSGSSERGALYAVYSFLEDYLGCKWLDSETEYIPKSDVVEIPFLERNDTPTFEYRNVHFKDANSWEFAVRNKLNGFNINAKEAQGGKTTYAGNLSNHSMLNFVPVEEFYKTHPEYFSLINGKRSDDPDRAQLCLSNPDVIKIAKERVLKLLDEHPDSDIVSFSQTDGQSFCQCDNCTAIKDEEGSYAGLYLRAVNEIATEVKKKYPKVMVQTFAYMDTRKVPKITAPADNVIMMLCDIECCFSHPLTDCDMNAKNYNGQTEDVNAAFLSDLKGWSKISKNLYMWDYIVDFDRYFMPFPNLYILNDNLITMAENNVKGVYEEGAYNSKNTESAALRSYMLAKFLWNPYYPESLAIHDFVTSYYGKAAAPIREYIDLISSQTEKVKDVHFTIYDMPDRKFFTEELVDNAIRLMNEAVAVSPDDNKVKIAYLPVEYLKLTLTPIGDYDQRKIAKEQYLNDLKSFGVTNYSEHGKVDGVGKEIDRVRMYATMGADKQK